MHQEKETALEAIRNLVAYYAGDFKEGCGYTGKQQLLYLTPPQAEIALRYGVPIGVRDSRHTVMGTTPGKPFRYVTITDARKLDRWLAFDSMDSLATIHADLPKQVQTKLLEFILQIMEIECPELLPSQKPVAPILGTRGDVFNMMCITNRTLRQAGQIEQAVEMWQRVLDSGDCFKALKIMGEYVEFDEAYPPVVISRAEGLWGDFHV